MDEVLDNILDSIGDIFDATDGIDDVIGNGFDVTTQNLINGDFNATGANPSDWFGDLDVEETDVDNSADVSFGGSGRKMCPTSHGCQGATDCDSCYGDY